MSSSPDPRAPRVTALVFFIVFLDLVGFGLIIPLLPFYVQRLGGSASTVGTLLACFSVAQFFATPVLGRLSDRYGRRPVILLSLVGNALSMGIFALATLSGAFWMLFASRILAGATAGNLAACQASIADVTTGPQRAAGMGRVGAGIGMGLVAGPLLSGELSKLSPSAPALGATALAFAGVVATFFFFPETHRPASSEGGAPRARLGLRDALSQRSVLAVLAIYFCIFFGLTNHQVAFTLLTARRFAWTEVEVGRAFALLGLVMFLIQGVLVGRLVKLFPEKKLFVSGGLMITAGMLLIGLAPTSALLVAGLALMSCGFGLTQPIASTIATNQAGEENQGAILGFAQSAGGLARTVGPLLGGLLFERVSPGAPYYLGAAALGVCALLGAGLPSAPAGPKASLSRAGKAPAARGYSRRALRSRKRESCAVYR